MDRRVPVEQDSPAAVATQLPAEGGDAQMAVETQLPAGDDLDVDGPVYRVGPHRCQLTDGDARITCKKCGRYVTTYK
eukprot:3374118-Amphidinium_carterae.1